MHDGLAEQEDWTAEQRDDIKKLIGDKSIIKAMETRHAELQLLESTKYAHRLCRNRALTYQRFIFEHVDRIGAAGFTPTDEDVRTLRAPPNDDGRS